MNVEEYIKKYGMPTSIRIEEITKFDYRMGDNFPFELLNREIVNFVHSVSNPTLLICK